MGTSGLRTTTRRNIFLQFISEEFFQRNISVISQQSIIEEFFIMVANSSVCVALISQQFATHNFSTSENVAYCDGCPSSRWWPIKSLQFIRIQSSSSVIHIETTLKLTQNTTHKKNLSQQRFRCVEFCSMPWLSHTQRNDPDQGNFLVWFHHSLLIFYVRLNTDAAQKLEKRNCSTVFFSFENRRCGKLSDRNAIVNVFCSLFPIRVCEICKRLDVLRMLVLVQILSFRHMYIARHFEIAQWNHNNSKHQHFNPPPSLPIFVFVIIGVYRFVRFYFTLWIFHIHRKYFQFVCRFSCIALIWFWDKYFGFCNLWLLYWNEKVTWHEKCAYLF